jgi:hypothetical protein
VVYGNQAAIHQFLTSVAQGFVQTPIELALLLVFVVALVLVFFIAFMAQKLKADRETKRRGQEMLEDLAEKLSLGRDDRKLLTLLAVHREKGVPEHLLLVNRHLFDACARKALAAGKSSEIQLNTLRLKAGFRLKEAEEVPSSSAELPDGSAILVQWASRKPCPAVIVGQGPGLMSARLGHGTAAPPRGASLRVAFHNAAGIFSFVTTVIGTSGDVIHMEHSSSFERLQRRRYYRRRERLPVFVRSASPRGPAGESVLLELGGGGASLENPRSMMKEGDRLEVSFSRGMDTMTLPARVLRISPDRAVIHVQFESPSESQRNRIMGFLFQQSKAV